LSRYRLHSNVQWHRLTVVMKALGLGPIVVEVYCSLCKNPLLILRTCCTLAENNSIDCCNFFNPLTPTVAIQWVSKG